MKFMTMLKFSYLFLFFTTQIFASINIEGTIIDYSNKEIFIYTYYNNTEVLQDKIKTDAQGHFAYKNPMEYNGIVRLMLAENRAFTILFTDSQNIKFSGTSKDRKIELITIEDPENKMFYNYSNNDDYSQKNNLLNQLLELYPPSDAFYKSLENEKQKLNKESGIDLSKYPFMEYYINLENNYLLYAPEDQKDANRVAKEILQHLINDGEDLEKTYLMNQLINNYLTYSISDYTNSVDQINALRTTINNLLEEAVVETSRGQNILVSVINLLRSYGIDYMADEYVEMANKLTCSISDELKLTMSATENTEIDATFENFNFSHKIKDAQSLYDIKSKYKMVIFWGSFCPHCQQEKPILKAYYPEFQSKGGEIISFAIETEKSEYDKFVSGLPWYNDADFLYWSSPIVKKYGIEGTPSIFLLDENNKIIAKGAKIDLLKDKIK